MCSNPPAVLFLSPYSFYAFYFAVKKKAVREDYVRLSVLLSPSISCQFFCNLPIKRGVEITYKMLFKETWAFWKLSQWHARLTWEDKWIYIESNCPIWVKFRKRDVHIIMFSPFLFWKKKWGRQSLFFFFFENTGKFWCFTKTCYWRIYQYACYVTQYVTCNALVLCQ